MKKFEIIKFKGNNYILVKGAITTKEDYENGMVSYAHFYDDGKDGEISRYGKKIGTRKDITFTNTFMEVEPKISADELLLSVFLGENGWKI